MQTPLISFIFVLKWLLLQYILRVNKDYTLQEGGGGQVQSL